ncbi:MAG: hypothetical protein IKV47_02955, partial [Oscillospiraceae bacterium]|nr:hypothetical protein [Oscillospiraceae bacterium]
MILVRNIPMAVGENEGKLRRKAARTLGVDGSEIKDLKIIKKSLDARRKNDVHYLFTVALSVRGDEKALLRKAGSKAEIYEPFEYTIPRAESSVRPVIVGFGPAGMFAALTLARAGLKPIVLERGDDVDKRTEKVECFWREGKLDTECNVQFGEGGAGTFSDGKLNTGTHDKRIAFVLQELHKAGAPENICYDAKPHIGTDILKTVVKNLREEIISLGGEVHFGARVDALETENGSVKSVTANGVRYECSELILAVGHSARDTFEMLNSMGIPMEQKPFSMGVRIEHKQNYVNHSQYGDFADRLPAADYKLNCRLPDGGSAYTFCMCPGGSVVAAASEEGSIVTNGMSLSRRDGENANSALLVTLTPEDFPGEGVLAGMYWQREIERRAYEYSGSYRAPAQTVGDFLKDKPSSGAGEITPTYLPGVYWGDIREVLPKKITDTIANAIPELAK